MAQVHWKCSEFPCRLKLLFMNFFRSVQLTYYSLCYNHFTTFSTALDSAFEPLFWIVDHTTKFMGPIMVTIVVILVTFVLATFYVCIFPHIFYQTDVFWSLFHLFFSHWLLINILFHYVMAVFTKPGNPPQAISEVVSICKKCITPKPPRTHHCTVCGTCVLKMDHHCPWINNCVGFYNHRYFFLFVVYMWFGTLYMSIAGYDVFKQHFFGNKDLIVPAFFFPINMAYHAWTEYRQGKFHTTASTLLNASHLEVGKMEIKPTMEHGFFHHAIVLQFLLCGGVSVALALLGIWHALLISKGQTSIEQHINKKERARLKKKNMIFKNPYDFGFLENWRILLGLKHGRSFFRHVLLPSRHDPDGNGIEWETANHMFVRSDSLDIL